MKNFHKNVFRMVLDNKGSFVGAVFIIAIGIFIYVAMLDTMNNLQEQIFLYYESGAMADVFAEVSGISEDDLLRLEEIPGIKKASGKMSADVRLLGSGQEEIVTVHLLSWREDETINILRLSDSMSDVQDLFLGAKMEAVYEYAPGDTLQLLCQGKAYDFTYRGTCQAPDYIYSIPPGGAMIPDGEVYDIACIDEGRMEELLGRKDCYTELSFLLTPGYRYEDVKSRLKDALETYGLISISDRDDQVSYDMVDGEMGELISVGTILPVIFMAISVFMLYVVLKKLIDRDQRLIGTMKAFGMTDRELMSAYLVQGAAAGFIGAVIGSILATPFTKYMFEMYLEFFVLPDTFCHNYISTRITGGMIAVGTGLLASWFGVHDILSIAPAQAMRSPSQKTTGESRVPMAWMKRLTSRQKMAFRSVVRNPFRGFLIALSIAFPFAMSSVLFSFENAAEQMYFDQFTKIEVYDLQLSLDGMEPSIRARQAGKMLDGVTEAEAVCRLPARLQHDNRTEQIVLYGLNRGSDLWKIMDIQGTFYEPPKEGIILNLRTAQKLHVKKGDTVRVQSTGVTVDDVELVISDIVEECFGSGCYMSMDGMESAFTSGAAANTVLLKIEPGRKADLKEQLQKTSRVTWLVDTEKVIGSYRDMMGSMIAMIDLFALLSVAAGGILIYNISMINIRERITEFGTLMILGMPDHEICSMLLMEHLGYFAAGIFLGYPGSLAVRYLIEKLMISDSYSVQLTVGPLSYGAAFGICMIITAAACMAENAFIQKINLTDMLKERE